MIHLTTLPNGNRSFPVRVPEVPVGGTHIVHRGRLEQSMQAELFAGPAAAGARTPLALVPITLVGVQSLHLDESPIEIEAVAVVSE